MLWPNYTVCRILNQEFNGLTTTKTCTPSPCPTHFKWPPDPVHFKYLNAFNLPSLSVLLSSILNCPPTARNLEYSHNWSLFLFAKHFPKPSLLKKFLKKNPGGYFLCKLTICLFVICWININPLGKVLLLLKIWSFTYCESKNVSSLEVFTTYVRLCLHAVSQLFPIWAIWFLNSWPSPLACDTFSKKILLSWLNIISCDFDFIIN